MKLVYQKYTRKNKTKASITRKTRETVKADDVQQTINIITLRIEIERFVS